MSCQTTLDRFGFEKSISHRNSVMETKYPIRFQLCQGQLSVITLNCNHKTLLYLQMFQPKIISILFKIAASALFLKYS